MVPFHPFLLIYSVSPFNFRIHFYLDLLFNNSLDIESPLHKKRVQSLCDLELPLININPFILTIETFILPTIVTSSFLLDSHENLVLYQDHTSLADNNVHYQHLFD